MKLKPIARNQTELTVGDTLIFFSYKTPVAAFVPGAGYVRTDKQWSRTTSKHIGQWLGRRGARNVSMRPQSFLDSLATGGGHHG